jgi:hypothetical protein
MSDGTIRGCVYGAMRHLVEHHGHEDTPQLRADLEQVYQRYPALHRDRQWQPSEALPIGVAWGYVLAGGRSCHWCHRTGLQHRWLEPHELPEGDDGHPYRPVGECPECKGTAVLPALTDADWLDCALRSAQRRDCHGEQLDRPGPELASWSDRETGLSVEVRRRRVDLRWQEWAFEQRGVRAADRREGCPLVTFAERSWTIEQLRGVLANRERQPTLF